MNQMLKIGSETNPLSYPLLSDSNILFKITQLPF